MKNRYRLPIAFLILLALLVPCAGAQGGEQTLEDALEDRLSSHEDLKWYSFALTEAGDVTLTVRGLQEKWDGYNTHWTVTVYAPDRKTVLISQNARGYNGNEYSPPLELFLPELEGGTYYIRVCASSSLHFTTDPYRLELERTYQSQQPYVRSEAGEYVMGEEPFQDRIVSADQVRWYSLEMAEEGDAVLYVTGLQENWDGYPYHWRCDLFREDMETAVASANVRGYSNAYGPAVLSAPDLPAGQYYVRMSGTGSSNPLMTASTTAPYEIRLIRAYHSAAPVYDGEGGVQTFRSAGDLIWSFDGTSFLKLNDGECFCALMRTQKDRAIVPILVSTDPAAVEYMVSATGERVAAGGPWHDKQSGNDYYYSKSEYIPRYSDTAPKTDELPMFYTDTNGLETSVKLMMKKLAEAEKEKDRESGEGSGIPWPVWAGVALAVLVVLAVLGKLSGKGESSSAGSYSGSYSGSGYSAPSGVFDGELPPGFDADDYVRTNCGSYITGCVSSEDLETIRSDPSLSLEDKAAAEERIRELSDLYY